MLASKPIDATTAVRAGRELFGASLCTPKAVLASDRRTMISVFGRAHYVRYDESSAIRLTDIARRVSGEFCGGLREIAHRSQQDIDAATRILKQFKGIGDTGADIYWREVQDAWTWVRPYFDDCATAATQKLGLPSDSASWRRAAMRAWPPHRCGRRKTTR